MKDNATNLWQFFDGNQPVNVMVVGTSVSDGKKSYQVSRGLSRFFAFEYLQNGEQTLSINGSPNIYVKANTVIFLPKNCKQEYQSKNEQNFLKKWIVFDGKYLEQIFNDYLPPNVYTFDNCDLSDAFDRILQITEEFKNDYEVLTDKIALVLFEIVIYLKNSYKRKSQTLQQKIKDFIDNNIEKSLTLEDICIKFSYSKNHIIRVFKNNFDMTPYQYILGKKIIVAKQYLSNTKINIKEICQILNFEDQHYFSNIFKQREGMSPLLFRQKNKNTIV